MAAITFVILSLNDFQMARGLVTPEVLKGPYVILISYTIVTLPKPYSKR